MLELPICFSYTYTLLYICIQSIWVTFDTRVKNAQWIKTKYSGRCWYTQMVCSRVYTKLSSCQWVIFCKQDLDTLYDKQFSKVTWGLFHKVIKFFLQILHKYNFKHVCVCVSLTFKVGFSPTCQEFFTFILISIFKHELLREKFNPTSWWLVKKI